MSERRLELPEEFSKQPAYDVLHFINTANVPSQSQAEILAFLNEYEITRALSAIFDLHGQPLGSNGARRIAGEDFGQRFEGTLYTNFLSEPSTLNMHVYNSPDSECEIPMYGLTIPLKPDSSLDDSRDLIGIWGGQQIKLVNRYPATHLFPERFVWSLQGCTTRLANALRSTGPTFLPAETRKIDQRLAA